MSQSWLGSMQWNNFGPTHFLGSKYFKGPLENLSVVLLSQAQLSKTKCQSVILHDVIFHDVICHEVICHGRCMMHEGRMQEEWCMMHDVMTSYVIYFALICPDVITILLLEVLVQRRSPSTEGRLLPKVVFHLPWHFSWSYICENNQHAKSQPLTFLRSGLNFLFDTRNIRNGQSHILRQHAA